MKNLTHYAVLLLFISTVFFACQPKTEPVPPPKEVAPYEVSPNEEANLKIVKEYVDALLTNDQEKAKSLVGIKFMDYGPAQKDSLNIDAVTSRWAEVAKVRSNQDAGIFVATALKVNEGNLIGEWVNVWGNYTATLNDSDYAFDVPWHRVFLIKDNKIELTRVWYDNLPMALDLGTVTPVKAK